MNEGRDQRFGPRHVWYQLGTLGLVLATEMKMGYPFKFVGCCQYAVINEPPGLALKAPIRT